MNDLLEPISKCILPEFLKQESKLFFINYKVDRRKQMFWNSPDQNDIFFFSEVLTRTCRCLFREGASVHKENTGPENSAPSETEIFQQTGGGCDGGGDWWWCYCP